MAQKLLIISHSFPPAFGIGGRRWAKFAKYLKRMGYDITVITAEDTSEEESVWSKDIEDINVISLPYKFPKSVANPKSDIYNKLLYYFNLNLLKLRDAGNYFDKTIFWEKQIQNKISEIITNQKINCVIVTSGPFRLSDYVMKLGEKFPDVKFIVDFRDLWTEDVEITSFSGLPEWRKNIEKTYEKETIYRADKITSVAPELNNYFNSLTIRDKFAVIPNGYDPEDFKDLTISSTISTTKIKFVFTGTLYINLGYIIEPFFIALAKLKAQDTKLFQQLEFEFIGRFPEKYVELIKEYGISEVFIINKTLSLKEVYSKISGAHYCMLFLNDIYNFALSTKFCEYISQRKKIVIVSNKGPASEFITKNNIGYWINPTYALPDLKELIQSTISKKINEWDSSFNTELFSVPVLTEKLAEIIEEKHVKHNTVNKRHVLLTFDYELFLGKRSGTVENCILFPTNHLLSLFKKHNFSGAIFFIDTTYIKKLSENNDPSCIADFTKIKNQLIQVLKDGHYVFPHLHPHWRDAIYIKEMNQWRLDSTEHYRLHSISEAERDELFTFSIKFIKELMAEASVKHEIDCYRAGGWCLQPFSTLKPHFEKHGLKYDFSALRDFKMEGKNIKYDFLHIPKKNIYSFSNEVESEDVHGAFKEIVISNLTINNTNRFLNKFLHKFLWYTKQRGYGDGYSAVDGEASVIRGIQNMDKKTLNKSEMVSVELLTYFTNAEYKKYIDENDFMHFISHPKMIGKHNIDTLDRFLKYANSKFDLNTDYKKMVN